MADNPPQSMSEIENQRIIRRFIEEMWNQRKLLVADELFAEDCVTHQLRAGEGTEGAPRSPASVKQEAAAWIAAFPDLRFTIDQMIASADRVATICTMHGTQEGAWMGVAPTHKSVT